MRDTLVKETKPMPTKDALSTLKNVGPAVRQRFAQLGIETIAQLALQEPDQLFERLSAISKDRVDPCMHDVFSATIHQARTGEPRAWWEYSDARKQRQKAR